MASTISAGNATNGLAVSSDNTGILELKTGTGAGTTALTIDTSQNATFAGRVSNSAGTLITESMTLLGTLTTTSGATQTLSGLTLTPYKYLFMVVTGVSAATGTGTAFYIDGKQLTAGNGSTTNGWYGVIQLSLVAGTYAANLESTTANTGVASRTYIGQTSYTTASTSISFTLGGTVLFDAGTITVYGVK